MTEHSSSSGTPAAAHRFSFFSTSLVALAALFWGLSGGIGGILLRDGWSPFVVSFYRGATGFICVSAWLALRHNATGAADRRVHVWSILAGFGIAGNFTFYNISIAEGSVAVAATLMYCAPVFVYLASFTLRLERPTAFKWMAIALVLLGVVLLTGAYDIDALRITPVGVAAGLASGASYAVFIFSLKSAGRYGSPPIILAIAFATLSVVLFVSGNASPIIQVLGSGQLPVFILLGLLGAGVSFYIYIIGLRRTAPAIASIVAMVEPVTASLFGVAILGEHLADLQAFGIFLVLVTVTLLSVYSNNGHISMYQWFAVHSPLRKLRTKMPMPIGSNRFTKPSHSPETARMQNQEPRNPSNSWDARFDTDHYVYGTEANEHVVEALSRMPGRKQGRAVELACGEGRNAVYLAQQGFHVTAVDSSSIGLEKTQRLANEHGVCVETICADALLWRPETPADILVTTWFHVPAEQKTALFRALTEAVRPGGVIIAEWFHPDQRNKGFTSGGPPLPEMMFTKDELEAGLSSFSFETLKHSERRIEEGPKHSGLASTVVVTATRVS